MIYALETNIRYLLETNISAFTTYSNNNFCSSAGAAYIIHLLQQYITIGSEDFHSCEINDLQSLTGIYHMRIENTFETHECIISFRHDDITMYTTYKDGNSFEITEFAKKPWIKNLIKFDQMSKSQQGYRYWLLWGITPSIPILYDFHVSAPTVKIISLHIKKLL